eukprot:7304-Heterococcus_DN1.PRE.5
MLPSGTADAATWHCKRTHSEGAPVCCETLDAYSLQTSGRSLPTRCLLKGAHRACLAHNAY